MDNKFKPESDLNSLDTLVKKETLIENQQMIIDDSNDNKMNSTIIPENINIKVKSDQHYTLNNQ